MNLENIYQLCQEIKNTSGKNAKEAILKREKDNEEFKQFLKYVFDSLLIYGIQSKKLKRHEGKVDKQSQFENLFEVFEYLTNHNTGRDVDVKLVQSFIESQDEKYHEFLVESITKSLKIGVEAKSINKGIDEQLVTNFEVMLSHPFEKYEDKIKGKEFYVTEKLDGTRALFLVDNGQVKGFSRQGKVLEGYSHIEEELLNLPNGFIYDGELLIKNADEFKDRDVLQQTMSIAGSKGDKSNLSLWIYDMVDIEGFKNGKSEKVYKERRELLDSLDVSELNHIKVLPVLYKGKDLDYVFELLNEVEKEGKEGLMINLNSPYETKRSSNILKLKTFKNFEDFCTGVFEGEGKYKGKLGGIIVNYKGYELGVGSGFTDEQRSYYWEYPEEIIDKLVEVKYFRQSSDKHGNLSVSFPVFRCVRTDKDEPSYN